ncbi:hypothetical protein OAN61_00020 [bacterium]|nr:hypothetical protein [bacterium]
MLGAVLSTPSSAAVTSVDLSGNLISGSKYIRGRKSRGVETFDADVTGIEAFATIKVETLILRECAFGPKAITALSSTLSTAAVTSVDLSGNSISGTTHLEGRIGDDKVTFDADMSGLELLCKALSSGRITTIKMSNCEFGPKAISTLSTQVTWSTAAVTSVDLSGNPITGGIRRQTGPTTYITTVGDDTEGITALCTCLVSVKELIISECGIGPDALSVLASTLSTAAVTSVDLSGNAIGASSSTTVDKSTAKTNCEAKQGVYASVDGDRFGRIKADPDSDNEVKLIWLDDGSESRYTKVDKLTVVVDGSSPSVTEVFSHVEALAAAISTSKTLQVLNISNCNFGPTGVFTLSTEVTWSTAAVERVNVLGNQLGESVDLLIDVFNKTERIRTMLGIDEGTVNIDLSGRKLDPAYLRLLATELNSTRATAAVTSVDLRQNPLTGGKVGWQDGGVSVGDDDAGITAISDVLPKSKITDMNMSNCGIGPSALKIVSSTLSTAAVERVDLSNNKYDPSMIDDELKTKVDFQLDGCMDMSVARWPVARTETPRKSMGNCGGKAEPEAEAPRRHTIASMRGLSREPAPFAANGGGGGGRGEGSTCARTDRQRTPCTTGRRHRRPQARHGQRSLGMLRRQSRAVGQE